MLEKIPEGARVTYARQFRRCGKANCRRCADGGAGHGPYWYAFWDQDGRRHSRYLGKHLPPGTLPGESEPTPTGLRVQTLGTFQVWRDGIAIPGSAWKTRPATALFKSLLTAERHCLHREQMLELLWPDIPPAQSRRQLYAAIQQLRRILDLPDRSQSFIITTAETIGVRPCLEGTAANNWLDASAFASAARAAIAGRDVGACVEAIALYGGAYLTDALYDDWATSRRAELRGLYLALLRHLADLHLAAKEHARAIQALRLVLATDRCHEQAAGALMAILAGDGARAEAIQVYIALENSLREDLGLVPSPELHARYTAILAHPTNLPAPLTSFVGRDEEQAILLDLLESTRLLTLIGVGGCGKTRLALQVAASVLYQYQDGAWLVDLAPIAEAQAVPQAILWALGVPERPNQKLLATIIEHLQRKRLLVVMDNCEHLLAVCADLLADLLASCPEVRVLATSREALQVAGEVVWPIPPMSLVQKREAPMQDGSPAPDRLSEAVQLFIARAHASRPALTVRGSEVGRIDRICRRLDGMPLAIELAAARAGSLPLEQIEARLDDRFALLTRGPRTVRPRQQTLRATMDWSYALLDEDEQRLLRGLSVFAGSYTAEAVAGVLEDAPREATTPVVRQTLDRLTAKSLVRRLVAEDEPRYTVLETVRHYGALRLQEYGETERTRRKHSQWYLEQLEMADAAWYSPAQPAALSWIDQEQENLRAALSRTVEARDAGMGARFLAALWRYWETRGSLAEGRRWQERVLGDETPAVATLSWARAMAGAGRLAELQGDYAKSTASYERSLALWRILGDRQGIADSLLGLGVVWAGQGDLSQAERLFMESLELNRSLAYRPGMIVALNNLGGVAYYRGENARAAGLWQESLDLSRRQGDQRSAARALNNLGEAARRDGDPRLAAARYRDGLAISRQVGDMTLTLLNLEGLSACLSALGQGERAVRLRGATETAREAVGTPITPQDREAYERDGAAMQTLLGPERFRACLAEGRTMELATAIELALRDGVELGGVSHAI